VGENIQALIDLLAEEITKQDLSHVSGLEIARGDPDHCLELLQIIHQLTVMMAEEDAAAAEAEAEGMDAMEPEQDEYDDEEEDEREHRLSPLHQQKPITLRDE